MSAQATPLPPSEGTAQIARSPKYFEYLGNPVTGSNLSNEQVDEAKILMKALQPPPGTSLRPLSLGVLVFLEYIVTRAAQPVPRKLLTLTDKAFKISNYHGVIAVKTKVWDEQKAFYGGLIRELQTRMRAKEQSSWRNYEAQLISQITALNKQWTAYLKQVFESADKECSKRLKGGSLQHTITKEEWDTLWEVNAVINLLENYAGTVDAIGEMLMITTPVLMSLNAMAWTTKDMTANFYPKIREFLQQMNQTRKKKMWNPFSYVKV